MKRTVELVLDARTVAVSLEEGRDTSTLEVDGKTFVAERRELMKQDASGELVVSGLVTSFEVGDLDAETREVQLTVFELAGSSRDDHIRLLHRGKRYSSHADFAGRRFALDGRRVRLGGPLTASLFWAKPVAKGFELCAAVGLASSAFLAIDHESFDATPVAEVRFEDGHEQRVLLDERC